MDDGHDNQYMLNVSLVRSMNMVIIIEVCHLSCKLINTSWIPALTRSPGSDDDDGNASDDAVDGETLPAIDDRLGGERHRRESIPGCNLEPANVPLGSIGGRASRKKEYIVCFCKTGFSRETARRN